MKPVVQQVTLLVVVVVLEDARERVEGVSLPNSNVVYKSQN